MIGSRKNFYDEEKKVKEKKKQCWASEQRKKQTVHSAVTSEGNLLICYKHEQ